jgi:hypothetical protein
VARLCERLPRFNPGIGPAAALVGSLVAFEALAYLTGYQPPSAAGRIVSVDLRDGFRLRRDPWPADPDCPLCQVAGARRAVAAPP